MSMIYMKDAYFAVPISCFEYSDTLYLPFIWFIFRTPLLHQIDEAFNWTNEETGYNIMLTI